MNELAKALYEAHMTELTRQGKQGYFVKWHCLRADLQQNYYKAAKKLQKKWNEAINI